MKAAVLRDCAPGFVILLVTDLPRGDLYLTSRFLLDKITGLFLKLCPEPWAKKRPCQVIESILTVQGESLPHFTPGSLPSVTETRKNAQAGLDPCFCGSAPLRKPCGAYTSGIQSSQPVSDSRLQTASGGHCDGVIVTGQAALFILFCGSKIVLPHP